ncbi:MAG: hypothetical protein CM15mP44_6490 [Candidatus Neomarinimicrobiota bacterium]|nr:MAG: hypothetical protein CM15mP44_6490 [Candidatus Neomarinimicrobiota bacterium]
MIEELADLSYKTIKNSYHSICLYTVTSIFYSLTQLDSKLGATVFATCTMTFKVAVNSHNLEYKE